MGAIGEHMLNLYFNLQSWGADDFDNTEKLTKLQGQLRKLLKDVTHKLGIAELASADEVDVRREWGFRYRISDEHEFTKVAPCSYEQAVECAKELQSYSGTVTVQIVHRVVMTSDWMPHDTEELAARDVAS